MPQNTTIKLDENQTDQTDGSSNIQICTTREGLANIRKKEVEMITWERVLPRRVRNWLDRLELASFLPLRVLVEPSICRLPIEHHFDQNGIPFEPIRDLVVDDVEGLVSTFAKITSSPVVDIRLEHIVTDACWKFHRDCVDARLLTTYRGLPTEWVQPQYAIQALREQKHYDGPVEHFRDNAVLMFKGSNDGMLKGVVHRSPAMENSVRTRLLLCLNKRSMTSPDPWATEIEFKSHQSEIAQSARFDDANLD